MVTQIQLGNIFSQNGKNVFGGTGTGLDTQTLINDLAEAKRLPALRFEERIEINTKKKAAFQELQTILARFKDASNFLRNPPGVQNAADNIFQYRNGNVTSNTAVAGSTYLTATVEPGTTVQNYTIDSISQLAKARKQETNNFALADIDEQAVFAAPAAGQFGAGTITVNGENITLIDGDSLRTVAGKFNAVKADTGISASILQTSPGNFKIIFTATQTGAVGDFDLDDPGTVTADPSGVLTNITFGDTQGADQAMFKVDNVDIVRDSNSIDDLVEGITLNLKQTTPLATTLTLDIQPDGELVKTGITNFIDAYNEFRLFVSRQSETNPDGSFTEDAVLGNNPSLRAMLNSINLELSRSVEDLAASDPSRLADLGITFADFPGDEETPFTRNILLIDEAELQSAISSDFEAVRRVFEFDFTSNSTNLQVFSRTNALDVNDFTLTINPVGEIFQATFGATTIDLEATAIGATGFLLKGPAGSELEGLELIYSSTASTTATVNVTQGIGDRLFNALEDFLADDTGSLDTEITSLEDSSERLQKEVDRIDEQIATFREQLLKKFSALEQAITTINNLLQQLDAQTRAQQDA